MKMGKRLRSSESEVEEVEEVETEVLKTADV